MDKTNSRIAKYIADAGICSRRKAEILIENGRVKVDGQVLLTPAFNVSSENTVEIDGKIIKPISRNRLWIYYKPVGLITTHDDPQNRSTVFEALKDLLPRVISVGRLDLNSEGLLLLTNSGEIARKFELPKSNIERVYKVRAYGNITKLMNAINNKTIHQVTIDGLTYKPKSIKLLSETKANAWFEVTLTEGKNREIRRIFEHYYLEVNRLIRTKYGKYELGDLQVGKFKEVSL